MTSPSTSDAGPAGTRQPRLLDRVRDAIRARHYSRRTEEAYISWVRRYILFHGKRHPDEEVLGQEVPWLDGLVHAKRSRSLPVVLTRDEVRALLGHLQGVPRLMALLLYGAGLRVLECARLRVKDIHFASNRIVVRAGKGDRDRVTMLPAVVKADLARRLDRVGGSMSRMLRAVPAGSNSPEP